MSLDFGRMSDKLYQEVLGSDMEETLILVDEDDNQIGTGEKMAVHRAGALHRCFSIFVLNAEEEVLLQKRATSKYHSGGLWTNTCCGHPRDGEATLDAAHLLPEPSWTAG